MPKNRGTDANMSGAELDCCGKIGAHTHREIFQPVVRSDFRGQREMRRRRFVDRRDAHQAGNHQAIFLPAARNEGVGFVRC